MGMYGLAYSLCHHESSKLNGLRKNSEVHDTHRKYAITFREFGSGWGKKEKNNGH